MIGEFLMNIIFNFVSGILALLPDISWTVDSSSFSYFTDVVSVAAYMLPMGTVSKIISLIISLMVFRIIIATVKAIWDVLPIV